VFGTLTLLVRDVIPDVLTSLFLVVAGGLESPIYREREAAARVLADFRPLSDAALRATNLLPLGRRSADCSITPPPCGPV
jgi:hypothetical protein